MRGSAPGERRGGRQKGTPNKYPGTLKQMILGALDKAGGEAYLMRQAQENPGPFMTLVGKVLPTTLAGDPDNPVAIEDVTAKRAAAKALLSEAFGKKPEP
jgi:hypothetical protein